MDLTRSRKFQFLRPT